MPLKDSGLRRPNRDSSSDAMTRVGGVGYLRDFPGMVDGAPRREEPRSGAHKGAFGLGNQRLPAPGSIPKRFKHIGR